MSDSTPTTSPAPPQGRIRVNVGEGSIDRTCPSCRIDDEHPRHIVLGVRTEQQTATLADGRSIELMAPVDVAYHHDCHAAMGCDICTDICEVNGGHTRIPGEQVKVPEHHRDIEPYEYEHDERGVFRRVRTKEGARVKRERQHDADGVTYADADEAHALHSRHAASLAEES